MVDEDWTEIAVFIHGITPHRNPGQDDNPDRGYDALFQNIQKELEKCGKPKLDALIKIVWNWNPCSRESQYLDQNLAEAQRLIANQMTDQEQNIRKVNKLHFFLWERFYKIARDIMLYGISDAMYYVSQDGEKTVREHVFKDLSQAIIDKLEEGDGQSRKVSLTILGHSAGSLIAHDFLYHIFGRPQKPGAKRKQEPVEQIQKLIALAGAIDKETGDATDKTKRSYSRLRVRRLYTFGSPLAPWFIRANSLLEKITTNQRLKLADIGLQADDGLDNPRWVNFWALTDVAAFPVSFLYDDQEAVNDEYVDVGLLFPNTHGAYWNSPKAKVAARIAHTF